MTSTAILVENLGKQYRIGKREPYKTLSGTLTETLSAPARKIRSAFRQSSSATKDADSADTIWSLKDVSFEIKQGEVVGIIGRNGAGKSTLLKILSRITEPTEGHVQLRGRVGSLLEVGTGFNHELTGRENIYLNGAVLGMRKSEIDRRFDEIVAFAEIEKFLDTPVKHYSSGMYMRLAFSVAAHLEPEILLVDEVLAVGDAEFQKKCLGRMGEVAREGRTVVLVSHNMAAMRNLCSRVIFLNNGRIRTVGETANVVQIYEEQLIKSDIQLLKALPIRNVEFGLVLEQFGSRVELDGEHAKLQIQICFSCAEGLKQAGIGIFIHTLDGTLVSNLPAELTGSIIAAPSGRYTCDLEIDRIEQYLAAGEYTLSMDLRIPKIERLIDVENIAAFRVPSFDLYQTGVPFEYPRMGLVPLKLGFRYVNQNTSTLSHGTKT